MTGAFEPEYAELGHNYCLLSATNETLAGFFGVARRTISNWIATHPEFASAVHKGRAVADGVVVRALFDRAGGFSHEVKRTTLYQGEERTITNTVSYPPDTQARMFWLRDRRRRYWHLKAEPAPEVADDMVAALDAAGESMVVPRICVTFEIRQPRHARTSRGLSQPTSAD